MAGVSRPLARALLLSLLVLRAPAFAAEPDAAAALLAVRDADPLELGRVAERFGDARLLALLGDPRVAVRLVALYAAPWLREPERALPAIAPLIASRDSELAPAAARAAFEITAALSADALAAREVLPGELTAVRAELQRTAALAWVRHDLRALAAAADAQLAGAGVAAPPARE